MFSLGTKSISTFYDGVIPIWKKNILIKPSKRGKELLEVMMYGLDGGDGFRHMTFSNQQLDITYMQLFVASIISLYKNFVFLTKKTNFQNLFLKRRNAINIFLSDSPWSSSILVGKARILLTSVASKSLHCLPLFSLFHFLLFSSPAFPLWFFFLWYSWPYGVM